MVFSLFLAVLLIYMVLAAQFESLIHPFTIMITLPLSITGALGGLYLTGATLNIFSMIGMIMLMGLVTKNAILLIDYTNQLREKGMERNDAIRRAGPVRLRPIMMTAMSTIAGMLPAAIGLGEGAETRAPMGICIVGGMLTSTVLTLVVIPVVYTILEDMPGIIKHTFVLMWRLTKRFIFGPIIRILGFAPAKPALIDESLVEKNTKLGISMRQAEESDSPIAGKPTIRLDSHEPKPHPSESTVRKVEQNR